MSSAPSARAPVPQSRMKQAPASVVTATHEVLPPNRMVPGPGVAIDPRVPQKRTRMLPPASAIEAHRKIVEIPDQLRGLCANLVGRAPTGRLLQRRADIGDAVEAVARARSPQVV